MQDPTPIPQPDGTTRINVPLDIPTELIDNGAIELYATNLGWDTSSTISAVDYSIAQIRGKVLNEYRKIVSEMGEIAGRTQAENQFDSFFNQ